MSHLIFILITSVSNITFQGRRIFNITPKHRGTKLPSGQGLHNAASAIIAYTKSFNRRRYRRHRCRHVWDQWNGEGGGEGRWLTLKTGSYRYCLTCACHLFIHFSFSWYGRWRKPLLYDSAAHDTHRLALIRAPFSICISSPFSRRRVRQRCGASAQPIPISSISRIRSNATALSFRQAGTVRERSWCCATASTKKRSGEAWEHDLSSDARIDSDSDSGAPKCTRPSDRKSVV